MGQGDPGGQHQTRLRPTITAMTFHKSRSAKCRAFGRADEVTE